MKTKGGFNKIKNKGVIRIETSKLPEWYFLLRPELRPTGERINKLEALRVKYEIPSEVFATGISSYPGAARILQINLYKEAKEKWPNISEKDLLKNVFVGRALKPEPYGYGMTPKEFEKIMEKINSLEELCDYVVSQDSKESEYEFDLSKWEKDVNMLKKVGIGRKIDWKRHKANVERMKKDNVKEKINVIMEEEAQKAIEKIRNEIREVGRQQNKITSDLRKIRWGLSKHKTRLIFSDKQYIGPHPSQNAIGFLDREFDYVIFCYFFRIQFRERLTRIAITLFRSYPGEEIIKKEANKLEEFLIKDYGKPLFIDSENCKKAPAQHRLSKILVWITEDSVLTLSVGFKYDNILEPGVGIEYGDYKNDPFSECWHWLKDRVE